MANYIIFSASSTIGQALINDLVSQGHAVFSTSRSDGKIDQDLVVNPADFDQVDAAFLQAKNKLGSIDGVVNCSGSLLLKPAHLTSKEQYQEVIEASLTTSFAIARGAGKHMTEGGSVVFISSAAALEGLANHDAIAAAKAGLIGLTLSCAATYAGNNLRFNCVAPGLTETNLTKNILDNDTSRKFSEAMHALKRLGKPEDISRAIIFLLDTRNSWITGQTLAVDGGLSCIRPKTKV